MDWCPEHSCGSPDKLYYVLKTFGGLGGGEDGKEGKEEGKQGTEGRKDG